MCSPLAGLGVDNAVIEDRQAGSADHGRQRQPFVAAMTGRHRDAGGGARFIQVLAGARGARRLDGELRPHARGFRVEVEIEFDNPLIGRQGFSLDVEPAGFRREIARARTFGFMRDVAKLWSAGYALGATFDNTLVVTDNRILNQDGLRFADEFVRHKALDAIGDLALAGAPLLGVYRRRAATSSTTRCCPP
jgi:UDP-3-O-[3-hydroxymyristoyl] N-acetylglucosamine deacetylase